MNNALDTPSLIEADGKRTRIRPIRIMDILVLTSTLAFAFILQEWLNVFQLPEEYYGPVLAYGLRSLNGICLGVSLATIYWLIEQERTTGKHFREPGHWVLAGSACLPVAMIAVAVFHSQNENGYIQEEAVYTLFFVRPWVLTMAASILVFGCLRCSGTWRWCLIVLAISSVLMALSSVFSSYLSQLPIPDIWSADKMRSMIGIALISTYAIGVVLFLLAIIQDHQRNISRDWLHWAGVLVAFIQIMCLPVLSQLMVYVIWNPPTNSGSSVGI